MGHYMSSSAIFAAALAAAGCGQLPTDARPSPGSTPDPHSVADISESVFGCRTSNVQLAGPQRYHYSWLRVRLPNSVIARDGQLIQYKLIVANEGEAAVGIANCTIPNTPEAMRYVTERLLPLRQGSSRTIGRSREISAWGSIASSQGNTNSTEVGPGLRLSIAAAPSGVGASADGWPLGQVTIWASPDPYGVYTGGWQCNGNPNCADASHGDSGGGDAQDPGNDPCKTGNPVMDSPGVQQGMAGMWAASDPEKPKQSDRKERGGWIIKDPDTNELSIQELGSDWVSAPCSITPPPGFTTNNIPDHAIGWIHTHPFENGEIATTCPSTTWKGITAYSKYIGGPSDDDVHAADTYEIARPTFQSYVIDKNQITRFKGTIAPNPGADVLLANYGRCGY